MKLKSFDWVDVGQSGLLFQVFDQTLPIMLKIHETLQILTKSVDAMDNLTCMRPQANQIKRFDPKTCECYYCHEIGHTKKYCDKLKQANHAANLNRPHGKLNMTGSGRTFSVNKECSSKRKENSIRHVQIQGLDFDANQRIDSRHDSRHTIAARIKVDSCERYHD